jgi:hypothetical protein
MKDDWEESSLADVQDQPPKQEKHLVQSFSIDFKALETFYQKLKELYPDDQDLIPIIQNLIAQFAKEA